MLLAVGAIWGASFLLNEIALRELEPSTLILGRIGFAAIALLLVLPFALGLPEAVAASRGSHGPLLFAGLVNTAVPFFLIAWGQQRIDSGLTGILLASAPLFTAIASLWLDRRQRVTGLRLAGFLVGFAGVVLLLGASPQGGDGALLGSLAIVGAALFYAVGGLYTGRRLTHLSPVVVATVSMLWAMLFALPFGIAEAPSQVPGWETILALLALGVVGTGLAYLLFFAIVAGAGASRAILVTYLVPTMAVAYGVTLLDEPLTLAGIGGLALILAGVALGTGALRRPARESLPPREADAPAS